MQIEACTDNEFTPDSQILAVGVLRGCEIILMEVTQDAGEIDAQGARKGLGDCEWQGAD